MSDAVAPPGARALAPRVSFAMLLGLAWALAAGQLLAEYWAATATSLPDADDAMRLVQVRAFLAGQGWFDLHEARLGGAAGYDTHWSRLVDAGLAALYLALRPFVTAGAAERLMLALWPVIWLLPCIAAVTAIAWRLGGREAALTALALTMFAGAGVQQFRPGRIDHHNVQIALSLAAVAAVVWADRRRSAATLAGLVSGLGLAVGFEALPFFVFAGAALAAWFVADPAAGPALRRYAGALALGCVLAFLIAAPPSRWSAPACDAIAINSAAAVVVAAAGLWIASGLRPATSTARLAGAALAGGAGLATFAAIEPQCLAGHYAAIDPAIRAIWLGAVSETKPFADLLARAPATALATLAFPLAAAAAAVLLARRAGRDFGRLAALAAFAAALVYMLVAVSGVSAAVWLGMPLVAAALVDLLARAGLTSPAARFVAALAASPTALTIAAILAASAALPNGVLDLNPAERQACVERTNYRAFETLPGRVAVNEMEWAPYLLAWTPHQALAGPYHRLSAAILAQHRIFAAPPAEARVIAAREGVDYLAACGGATLTGLDPAAAGASLWQALAAGRAPDWLERLDTAGAFTVYRVRR